MSENKQFYVYAGKRFSNEKFFTAIILLNDGVVTNKELLFSSVEKCFKVVGGVYSGAVFTRDGDNKMSAKGLNNSVFEYAYPSHFDVVLWRSYHETALADKERHACHVKFSKNNPLKEMLAPVIKIYKQGKFSERHFIEQHVLKILRESLGEQ